METDLSFLHCNFMPRCDARVNKYFEDYYSFQFMASGAIELLYNDDRHMLQGSWFWTSYPGPHIKFHVAPHYSYWEHRYVAFKGPLVNRWKAQGLWLEGAQPMPLGPNYQDTFDKLLSQVKRLDHWGKLRAINLLESILIELAEARRHTQPTETLIDNILRDLTQPNNFSPNYQQLASNYGVSVSTLRKHFYQATGTAIHQYVLQRRMNQACILLGETDLPLKIIAAQLGYRDIYFFSRQFRLHMCVAPSLYRKSRQH